MDTVTDAPVLPSYLKRTDGAVSIDFTDIPAKIDGGSVLELVMREPRVQDQLSVEGKSAMKAEVAIFANLCDLPPEAIAGLSLKQYGRLQEAYASFFGLAPNDVRRGLMDLAHYTGWGLDELMQLSVSRFIWFLEGLPKA